MKNKKLKLRDIIFFILGIIVTTSTIALAATYKFKADEVEYIPNDTKWSVGNAQEAMNELYTLYKIKKSGSSGIFSVSDNMLPSGYMKSTANDNNVIFGGYCWKVIRVTDDNEVRMIYNGTPSDGQCTRTGTDTQIGTSKYSTTYNVTAYTSSTVKTVVDNWYNTNLATNYSEKISTIDLITREEASTVGGGYLVSGQRYWTKSATGNNESTADSCSYSTCGGQGTCTSYSGGINIVNTDGSIISSNNGTYSTCNAPSKTCENTSRVGNCVLWRTTGNYPKEYSSTNGPYSASGEKDAYDCYGYVCYCVKWKGTESCSATPQGSSLAVRPVITLKSNAVLQGGEGTTTNPYYMK